MIKTPSPNYCSDVVHVETPGIQIHNSFHWCQIMRAEEQENYECCDK